MFCVASCARSGNASCGECYIFSVFSGIFETKHLLPYDIASNKLIGMPSISEGKTYKKAFFNNSAFSIPNLDPKKWILVSPLYEMDKHYIHL